MFERGDSVPHFNVKTVQGNAFSYSSIWQRRNLVLVVLPASDTECPESYVSRLMARTSEFRAHNGECVMTRDLVPGMPSPGVVIADRWGEIAHLATPSPVGDLPAPEELLEWLQYLEHRCPECEGEAK